MTIDQMRVELERAYPHSSTWKSRVSNMSERQVFRIHREWTETGKFEKLKKQNKKDGTQLRMNI